MAAAGDDDDHSRAEREPGAGEAKVIACDLRAAHQYDDARERCGGGDHSAEVGEPAFARLTGFDCGERIEELLAGPRAQFASLHTHIDALGVADRPQSDGARDRDAELEVLRSRVVASRTRESDHEVRATGLLVLAHHHHAGAGSRAPVHVAQVVAGLIFVERVE